MKILQLHGAYAGQVQDLPFHIASNLIQGGFAKKVTDEVEAEEAPKKPEPETAALKQPETAVVQPAEAKTPAATKNTGKAKSKKKGK